jgi:hypothetical protein
MTRSPIYTEALFSEKAHGNFPQKRLFFEDFQNRGLFAWPGPRMNLPAGESSRKLKIPWQGVNCFQILESLARRQ